MLLPLLLCLFSLFVRSVSPPSPFSVITLPLVFVVIFSIFPYVFLCHSHRLCHNDYDSNPDYLFPPNFCLFFPYFYLSFVSSPYSAIFAPKITFQNAIIKKNRYPLISYPNLSAP